MKLLGSQKVCNENESKKNDIHALKYNFFEGNEFIRLHQKTIAELISMNFELLIMKALIL